MKEQKAKEIRSEISVISSQANKNITQVQGRGAAQAKNVLANATATATNITISATSSAYKELAGIQFTPANDLDKFIYYTNLQTTDGENILYNINQAIIKPSS